MKKNAKLILIILLIFTISLCFVGVIVQFRSKQRNYEPHPIRPKDFPKILIAPENATSLDHSVPSWQVPNVYSLHFRIEDPFPSDTTREFIENHLRANGWRKLKYHLLNPHVPAEYPNPLLYDMYRDTNGLNEHDPEAEKNRFFMWRQDWVNKNDENISVTLTCADSVRKQVYHDKPQVSLVCFKRDSWIRTEVLRYKKLHSEEFAETVATDQPKK